MILAVHIGQDSGKYLTKLFDSIRNFHCSPVNFVFAVDLETGHVFKNKFAKSTECVQTEYDHSNQSNPKRAFLDKELTAMTLFLQGMETDVLNCSLDIECVNGTNIQLQVDVLELQKYLAGIPLDYPGCK